MDFETDKYHTIVLQVSDGSLTTTATITINVTDIDDTSFITVRTVGANLFNQNLNDWDVLNVENMERMFRARPFNGDISGWQVGNVTNMREMFDLARGFNQNISSWDVSKVEDMNSMFSEATLFNQDLSGWNTINVTECSGFASNSAMAPENIPTTGPCFEFF